MTSLRVAVVGCGTWGSQLASCMASLSRVKLVALCDPDQRRTQVVGESCRAAGHPLPRSFRHLDDALTSVGVDAVVVATPPRVHVDCALSSIDAGANVFVEKPFAMSTAGAMAIRDAAARKGLLVMVGHIVHYDPALAAVVEQLGRGEFGTLQSCVALRLASTTRGGVGAWWSMAPHDVSWTLRAFGGEPVEVRAANARAPDCDEAFAQLRFANGGIGTVSVSASAGARRRIILVKGDLGAIVADSTGSRSIVKRVIGPLSKLHTPENPADAHRIVQAALDHSRDVAPAPAGTGDPLRRELEAFVAALLDGKRYYTTADEGVRVTRVLEAGQSAARAADAPLSPGGIPIAEPC